MWSCGGGCGEPGELQVLAHTGSAGTAPAIASKTLRDSGYEVEPEQVVVTNGGKQAVYEAFQLIVNDGDEVIIPSPYWTSYPEMVKLAGGKPVEVFAGADVNYEPNLDDIEAARTDRTKRSL